MKKIIIGCLTFIGIIVILCLLFLLVICINYHQKESDTEKEIKSYLAEHYDENMEIQSVGITDCIVANCNPVDNKNIEFQVFLNVHQNQYIDTYLKVSLEQELKKLIDNEIGKTYSDYWCDICLEGNSWECYNRLYDFYVKNKRAMTWQDEDCTEKVQIRILIEDSDVEQKYARELAEYIDKISVPYTKLQIHKKDDKKNVMHLYP